MAESPSTYFPSVGFQFDYALQQTHKTEMLEFRSGREQRRAAYDARGYRRIRGTTVNLTQTVRRTVIDFFNARRGSYEAFYIFRSDPAEYSDYAVGSVSASATFTLPFKAVTGSTTVKVDGVTKTHTISSGTGTGGEDQVLFSGRAQTGAATVTLTGKERHTVRFASDNLGESFIQGGGVFPIFSLELKELR